MPEPLFAFFDEYGEEGFSGKASEWFVLSAALQAAEEIDAVRACYAAHKAKLRRDDKWCFHFVNCDHRARLAFIEDMKPAGYVFMSAAVHKPSLTVTDNFKRPYYLYFFAAKLLLERISWICRTQGRRMQAAFFSNRRGLKADELARYINLLHRKDAELKNGIDWAALGQTDFLIESPKNRIGLQLADLKAGSVGHALEPRHGITEPRYLLELKEHVYNRKGSRLSYGLKLFPRLTDELRAEPRFAWLEEFDR